MKDNILFVTFIFNVLIFKNDFSQKIQKDSITLKDAIRLTLVNQPLILQALEQVNSANARISEQNSFYYPKINANLSYVRIGPIPTIEFGGFGFTLAPDNNYDMHKSASQLVYDFGKRDAMLDLMKSYKLSSEGKINLIKNNLTYRTIQIFYTILFLKKSIDVNNEQINTLNKHLEITNKKVQSVSATDFDVLTTQVRVADTENQKKDIPVEAGQAVADLKAYMSKIKTSELQVEHAMQAVSRAEIQYRDGVITNLDLIDAETSLAQAKLGLLQIRYRYVLG